MYSNGPPNMAVQKQDDQLELTYSNYVRIQDVTLKTCRKRWVIGRSGERGSGISVLVARHNDDDDLYVFICMYVYAHVYIYIYIYIYISISCACTQIHMCMRERERERECVFVCVCVCVTVYVFCLCLWLGVHVYKSRLIDRQIDRCVHVITEQV